MMKQKVSPVSEVEVNNAEGIAISMVVPNSEHSSKDVAKANRHKEQKNVKIRKAQQKRQPSLKASASALSTLDQEEAVADSENVPPENRVVPFETLPESSNHTSTPMDRGGHHRRTCSQSSSEGTQSSADFALLQRIANDLANGKRSLQELMQKIQEIQDYNSKTTSQLKAKLDAQKHIYKTSEKVYKKKVSDLLAANMELQREKKELLCQKNELEAEVVHLRGKHPKEVEESRPSDNRGEEIQKAHGLSESEHDHKNSTISLDLVAASSIEVPVDVDYQVNANEALITYESQLTEIMQEYGVSSEAEVFAAIIGRSCSFDPTDRSERTAIEARCEELLEDFRKRFDSELERLLAQSGQFDGEGASVIRRGLASAWFTAAYDMHPSQRRKTTSFAWSIAPILTETLAHYKAQPESLEPILRGWFATDYDMDSPLWQCTCFLKIISEYERETFASNMNVDQKILHFMRKLINGDFCVADRITLQGLECVNGCSKYLVAERADSKPWISEIAFRLYLRMCLTKGAKGIAGTNVSEEPMTLRIGSRPPQEQLRKD